MAVKKSNEEEKKFKKKIANLNYREKNPKINSFLTKKNYWKKWFDEDVIKKLYDKHKDEAFAMLRKYKKEYTNTVRNFELPKDLKIL